MLFFSKHTPFLNLHTHLFPDTRTGLTSYYLNDCTTDIEQVFHLHPANWAENNSREDNREAVTRA